MTRNYKEEYQRWLDSPALSESEWEELNSIANDEKEIESRFFAPLEFGTAGLRGTMKLGLHQMNVHIIRHATQAFANVIKAEGEEAMKKGIAICFDCRNNSELFAHEAACVMAANGIHVRIFDALRPTPELSFAVRYYGTTAGLNITASHNPKEYNGYKVYWSDGAQLPPQHAEAIAEQMSKIFLEIIVAPKFTDEALAILTRKKNLRLLELDTTIRAYPKGERVMRKVAGGLLVQEIDDKLLPEDGELKVVTKAQPTAKQMEDLMLAWKIVKHAKSNGIAIAKDHQSLGIGPGQVNRIWSTQMAIERSGDKVRGAALASDAFFPFDDCVKACAEAGISCIIQPGGSVRDQDSIDACDRYGIAMVFTGMRHFKH